MTARSVSAVAERNCRLAELLMQAATVKTPARVESGEDAS